MIGVPEPTPISFQTPELAAFYSELASTGLVARLIELCRDEDLGPIGGPGDITSTCTIDELENATAAIVPRQAGVVAGLACVPEILARFAPGVRMTQHIADGGLAEPGKPVATLAGQRLGILSAERTILNLVCRLSGVATRTRSFVEAIRAARPPRPVQLCDTRKTTPGLRVLEKYAVRCGGGHSHRLGLHDAVLIKDNHLAGLTDSELPRALDIAIGKALFLARRSPLMFIEVEVDTLSQFESILRKSRERLDIVLLDNMPPDMLRQASTLRDQLRPTLLLEASGGVRLDTIAAIAQTGVDRISVGSLTHGATSLDFGLDAVEQGRSS